MKSFKDIYKEDLLKVFTELPRIIAWIVFVQFFPHDIEFYLNIETLIIIIMVILLSITISSKIKHRFYNK